ncbi:uncharacterized protein LOC117324544 [Pecten maximus]|uniref:uncharacterized protein LOC117324544 n=1 Tax=Pecten maximus TaxID=6579 RepID=UPI0014586190|nr:uncharacterized protein LOC117324544 [Pecten maximus]
MVLPSSYPKYAYRTSISKSVKRTNSDNTANNSVKTEDDNKKKVLHKFWRSLTPQSAQRNIPKSPDGRQATRVRLPLRPEIHIPKIMLTPPEDHAGDVVHQRHAVVQRYNIYSDSFQVNRHEDRLNTSTPKSLRPWTNGVQPGDVRIKSDSIKVQSGFLGSQLKQTPKRPVRSSGRYLYRRQTPRITQNNDERNIDSVTVSETDLRHTRKWDTCSDCAHEDLTQNSVSCSELHDVHRKDEHSSHGVDLSTESDVDTVYAIFAPENDKQSSTKFVRICDSAETCLSDYSENEILYNDSCVGFQDVDLSIDPTTLSSLSDDWFL